MERTLRTAERLAREGREALAAVPPERRLAAWCGAIDELRDPRSARRQALDAELPACCRLSPAGLAAGLETILAGVARRPAEAIFQAARDAPPAAGLTVAVLASNVPGLAVQPLLPALALGAPMLLKSPSAEPFFVPTLLEALAEREPRLSGAYAAAAWKGGEGDIERRVFAHATRVLAYGGAAAINDLAKLAGEKLVAYGPKASLAVLDETVDPADIAPGLARDVALFDQRGCLSIQVIYTAGDASALARALGEALAELAHRWPPGDVLPQDAVGVQQVRAEAALRGLERVELESACGTVVVEPEPGFTPSPGLRLVRVHPLPDLERLPAVLERWVGQLQGVALAGEGAWRLLPRLERLGISRAAPPGELQSADATWANGGIAPLDAFAAGKS